MSLVTTPTRELATCVHCASTRVMSITMTLTDGSVVDFVSCHRCERKTWAESGTGLEVSDVLSRAKKTAVKAAAS
jgi:transcription elongation factor Elf1